MRAVVVGTSGSGKSTLGRTLARAQGIGFIDLDDLHWGPDWTIRPTSEFLREIEISTRAEDWVVAGNFAVAREIIWRRATDVIWLDLPLRVTFWRLVKRTLRRLMRDELLWHGNRETVARVLTPSTSILAWAVRSHRSRRGDYSTQALGIDYPHLRWHRLRSAAEMGRFSKSRA